MIGKKEQVFNTDKFMKYVLKILVTLILFSSCSHDKYTIEEQRDIIKGFNREINDFQEIYYRFPENQEEFYEYIKEKFPYVVPSLSIDSIKKIQMELERKDISEIKGKYDCNSFGFVYALLYKNKEILACYPDSIIIHLSIMDSVIYSKKYDDILDGWGIRYLIRMYDKEGKCVEYDWDEVEKIRNELYLAKSQIKPKGVFSPAIVRYSLKSGLSFVYLPENVNKENLGTIGVIENYLKNYLNERGDIEEIVVPQNMIW